MTVSLSDLEAVYRERGADFFRLALARAGDPEAAREAVQDGFANAIRGRASYRGGGPLEAWVARCVINAARDAFRRRRWGGETPETEPLASREQPDAEVAAVVRAAVARLPQRQRDALFLRFYLDLSYEAIAETLGIEVGTVSAMLHAARAALATSLQEVAL